MLLSVLLLSPVFAFCAWLYWYLLAKRSAFTSSDALFIAATAATTIAVVWWVHAVEPIADGPIWTPVLAALLGYKAFIIPLTVVAVLRLRRLPQAAA